MAAPMPLLELVTELVRRVSYCQADLCMLTECDFANETLDLTFRSFDDVLGDHSDG